MMKMMKIVERRRDKIGRKYKRNTREAAEHSKIHPQELEERRDVKDMERKAESNRQCKDIKCNLNLLQDSQ